MNRPTVAVVGAGLASLAFATELQRNGAAVRIFERERGAGGRAASRRAGGYRFDHGAQYFTVRDPAFAAPVASWESAGVAAEWAGTIVSLEAGRSTPEERRPRRLVGVNRMRAIAGHLAQPLDVAFRAEVAGVSRAGERWTLAGPTGASLGTYDRLVLALPAPQIETILELPAPLLEAVHRVRMAPSWTLMMAFDRPLSLAFDGAFVHGSPLSWIARDSSKPGRKRNETWVAHASADWSTANLEMAPREIIPLLLSAFQDATGLAGCDPAFAIAHRWRYSNPTVTLDERFLFDAEAGVGVCGDWCGGPRVEGAYLSGLALAGRLVAT